MTEQIINNSLCSCLLLFLLSQYIAFSINYNTSKSNNYLTAINQFFLQLIQLASYKFEYLNIKFRRVER